jgi:hypothetical protein
MTYSNWFTYAVDHIQNSPVTQHLLPFLPPNTALEVEEKRQHSYQKGEAQTVAREI